MMNQIMDVAPARPPESSLRDIYYLLFRHKKLALTTGIVVLVLVIAGTFLLPEIFESEAMLLVKLGRESVSLDPTVTTGQIVTTYQSREQEINSEIEILRSRELTEQVVNVVGVEALLRNPLVIAPIDSAQGYPATAREREEYEKAILAVSRNLLVEPQKNSNIIIVRFEAKSPMLANTVITTLINSFLDKHIKVHATEGSFEFFTEQTTGLRDELTTTEAELTELKKSIGIASLEEQRSNLLERITALEREIDSTRSDRAASRSKVQELERLIEDLPNMVESQRVTGNDWMNQDLYRLKLDELDLLSRYSEDSREVREIRRQIEEATLALSAQSQTTYGSNTTVRSLQQELLIERALLAAYESRTEEVAQRLTEARGELTVITDNEARLAQLERTRDLQEENYKKYYDNLEQARIDREIQRQKLSNISVIQEATMPIKPVSPNKTLNVALGLVLAVFSSISLAFFAEFVDHSIKSQEDVEQRLQLHTLIALPVMHQNLDELN